MRLVFILTTFFISRFTYALPNFDFCEKQIYSLLKKWQAIPAESIQTILSSSEGKSWKIPTSEIGRWIFITTSKTSIELIYETEPLLKIVTLTPSCSSTTSISLKNSSKRSNVDEYFSDVDLKLLLKNNALANTSVLFYIWSPRMNLSVKGLLEILKMQSSKFDVIPLMDSEATNELANEVVRKNNLPRKVARKLSSQELIERSSNLHYPIYITWSKAKRFELIPGYIRPEDLIKFGIR